MALATSWAYLRRRRRRRALLTTSSVGWGGGTATSRGRGSFRRCLVCTNAIVPASYGGAPEAHMLPAASTLLRLGHNGTRPRSLLSLHAAAACYRERLPRPTMITRSDNVSTRLAPPLGGTRYGPPTCAGPHGPSNERSPSWHLSPATS